MIKKIFVFAFVMIFLIGIVSAAEWDNVKDYDEDTKILTVTNALGFGEEIVKMQLRTPHTRKLAGWGEQYIAEIEILNLNQNYNEEGFGRTRTYDILDGMTELNRDITLKYRRTINEWDQPIYEQQNCRQEFIQQNANGTENREVCDTVLIGYEEQSEYEWIPFTELSELPPGKRIIRLYTDVQPEDYVEWIPDRWFGERIHEWAAFQAPGTFLELTNFTFGIETLDPANWTIIGDVVVDPVSNLFVKGDESVAGIASLNGSLAPNFNSNLAGAFFNTSAGGGDGGDDMLYVIRDTSGNSVTYRTVSGASSISLRNFRVDIYNETNMLELRENDLSASSAATSNVSIAGLADGDVWSLEFRALSASSNANEIRIEYFNYTTDAPTRFGVSGSVALNTPVNATVVTGTTENFTANSTVTAGTMLNSTFMIWFTNGTLFTSIVNSTNGTDITNTTGFTVTGFLDGIYLWNVFTDMSNSTDTITVSDADNNTFTVDLGAPTVTITSPEGIVDYHKSGNNLTVDYSIVDASPEFCAIEYNQVNFSVDCSGTSSSINITNSTPRDIILFANDSAGLSTAARSTWSYDIFESSRTYNASTFETAQERFIVNLTYNDTAYTSITATMNYKSSTRSVGLAGVDPNRLGTSNFAIPIGVGSNNFNWSFVLTNASGTKTIISDTDSHNVGPINFTLCGPAPLDIPYLNFTFRNETLIQENVTATFNGAFTFRLGEDASVNKTITFTNGTENPSYAFCAFPQNRTMVVSGPIDYNNGASQQRTFTLTDSQLTNVTTNTILFLLPTSAGLFTSYNTVQITGSVVTGVLAVVSRAISGVPTEITSGTTDGSGLITFFLNPDLTYDYVFSKTGFANSVFSLQPNSPSIYVITMSSAAATIVTGVDIGNNLSFSIVPSDSNLTNQTTYTFGVNVTSGNSIGAVTLVLRNTTNDVIGPTISGTGVGFTSNTFNVQNNTRIIGQYTIVSGNESITGTQIWIVGDFYTGSYSLERQAKLFLDYDFRDFTRILIVLLVIMGLMIFMTRGETTDSSESKIMILVLLVWGFSIVGWLNTGLSTGTNDIETNLARFGNQYGIAILTSIMGTFFILRRIFIRRI